MKRWIIPILAALLAVGTAQVAAAQGQSQGKGQGQDKSHSQGQDHYQYDDKGKDKDQHKDGQNHGQVVSECNHQANQRNLKGQDRKDFTEWCESRGGRYQYDYNRYGSEKTCYQRANNKGLKGDKRANFLDKCFAGELGKKNKD
jgi:Ni/Co efflux regulator RcnB